MNETGVLGHFIRAFGKIVSMMQFNMYHHYTVDEHLLRCIGVLAEIERGGNDEFALANDLMRKIQPEHRAVIYIATVPARHRQGPDRGSFDRRRPRRAAALSAARLQRRRHRDRGLADRKASDDVDGGAVARPLRPQDHREFRRGGAVASSSMKLLTILTTADIRARRPRRVERLEGAAAAHAVLRDRAGADRRLLGGQPRPARRGGAGRIPRRPSPNGRRSRARRLYRRGTIRPTGSRSTCRDKIRHARFVRASRAGRQPARDQCRLRRGARRHRTDGAGARPSLAAVDHRRRLRRRPAPTSSTRRSTRRPTGARSTPSRSRGNSTATRTRGGAPRGSAR